MGPVTQNSRGCVGRPARGGNLKLGSPTVVALLRLTAHHWLCALQMACVPYCDPHCDTSSAVLWALIVGECRMRSPAEKKAGSNLQSYAVMVGAWSLCVLQWMNHVCNEIS